MFVNTTCSVFDTCELDRKANTRKHQEAKKSGADLNTTMMTTWQQKKFNLETYKYHSLGDYWAMIEMFGTCDSYMMEVVSEIGSYQTIV